MGIFQWILKRCCGVHGTPIFCQGFLKRSVGVVLSLPISDKVPSYHIGGLQWQHHLHNLASRLLALTGKFYWESITLAGKCWRRSNYVAKSDQDKPVKFDHNNPVFQENLLSLQKADRLAALNNLNKIRKMTWNQVCRVSGLEWEKIISVTPQGGIDAICSLRINQSRRTTAYRGVISSVLSIAPDHDNIYGLFSRIG